MNKKINYKNIIFGLIIILGVLIIGKVYIKPKEIQVEKIVIKKEHVKTANEISKNENIVFLGDSITDFYPFDEIYEDLPIINSGISGYRTDEILPRMEELVYRYNPTSVYILIGTNDFREDSDEDLVKIVEENIKKIVENIKQNRKKTKVYIQSIYPVNKKIPNNATEDRENEEIKEVNKYLKKFCKENDVKYIDLYKSLIDSDGNFAEIYTKDGLHPNSLGYAKITRVLLPYIYGIQ